jgi:hypothetical protein
LAFCTASMLRARMAFAKSRREGMLISLNHLIQVGSTMADPCKIWGLKQTKGRVAMPLVLSVTS